MKRIKRIGLVCTAIAIIMIILFIHCFEMVTKVAPKVGIVEHAEAGQIDEGTTGVQKGGTLENFANDMPSATMFFNTNNADTTKVGKDGYDLITDYDRIVKVDIPKANNETESRVAYIGPDDGGVPLYAKGYVTRTGLVENAPETDRISFSMRFHDVVTMNDSSTKNVIITISNIYINNGATSEIVKYWIGWKGNGLAVYPCNSEFKVIDSEGLGMAMHCDVSIKVVNEDDTPIEGESLLLEVKDLDVPDKTRFFEGETNSQFPRKADSHYTNEDSGKSDQEIYDSDYREGIYILNGALSDAYMPETNWLEVKRLANGNNANGLRFSIYGSNTDESHTLNSGFLTIVDSKESNYRWYGSLMNGGTNRDKFMGTVLFESAVNHWIKAKSSTGGNISNYVTEGTILGDSDNYTSRSFQHVFADGTTVNYVMNAKENHYLKSIKIDNVEFLPTDFTSVQNGEQKDTTITKNSKTYNFNITKNTQGQITKAVYVFANNDANHEIEVVWDGDDRKAYTVEYYYDGQKDDTKTDNNTADVGTIISTVTDKLKDGYIRNNTEGLPLTISVNSDENIIKVYYVKRTDLSYTVNYLERGTNNPVHDPKTVNNQTFGTVINSTNEVIDINSYAFDGVDKNNLTISTEDNIINIYYVKEYTGKVQYYEKGTTNVLKPEISVPKLKIGDILKSTDYNTEITGYTYDSAKSDPITISENEDENVLILYYTKIQDEPEEKSYIVNYIDKDTNNKIHTSKTVENAQLDSVIKAKDEVIDISNYIYDSSDKEEITINKDNEKNIINLYYTKKKGKVIVKYIDQDTNKEILKSTSIIGNVDDPYITKSEKIDGYEFSKSTENTYGKIAEKDTTVIYYYKAKKESVPAKEQPKSLPKTGGILNKYVILIGIINLIGIAFGYRYFKFKNIK